MFNKSLAFLFIAGLINTTALAQTTADVPNCFNHLNQFGTYHIQFRTGINGIQMEQVLTFLTAAGFRVVNAEYPSRKAAVNHDGSSFQEQNNAMAALQVLVHEGLIERLSCRGMAGPRPRIGVGN